MVLGAPGPTFGDVLVMELDKPTRRRTRYPATLLAEVTRLRGSALGVAAGNIGGGAAPEIVVLSGSTLHVYVDELPANDRTPRDVDGRRRSLPVRVSRRACSTAIA